jgi:hypothetical protein
VREKPVCFAWFVLHFLLITTFSCRETLWVVAQGQTIFPSFFNSFSEKAGTVMDAALGQHLAASNPTRQALATYLRIAGIEKGYGYFAPNVPASYKVVFELHYPDGSVEYQLPHVHSAAAGLRLACLLDEIARTRDDTLREYLVKMLASSIWRDHPDVTAIRAVFGSISLPNINEFEHGKRESYEFLYAYDFSRSDKATELETP